MDLLLSRYSNIAFIFEMNFCEGIELIDKANEKQIEDKLFMRWIPYQEYIGFTDFKSGLFSSSKTESKKDILDKVRNILNMRVGE